MSSMKTQDLSKSADIVIIGGGVIGLSIARELALRGVSRVTLIERGGFGAEASCAAGGILAPQVEADGASEFFRFACTSRDKYSDFARALHEETGVDVELDTTGTLYLGFTADDENELRRRHQWQTTAALRVEWLTGDEARRLEPNISPRVRCALRFPNDYQVENRRLIDALVKANQKLDVNLISNCEVRALRIEGGKLSAVETSAGLVSARVAVLAAGAWSSQISLTGLQRSPISIEPVRGQILCFQPQPQIARHVIYTPRGYLVPRRDGRLLAGSTSEHAGFDKRVTAGGIESVRSIAIEIAPQLKHEALKDSWAGFRPRASDDLPVLGRSEEVYGFVYATGHYRNGILLAPITAEVIADLIVDGVYSTFLERFSPNRFCVAHA